MKTCWKYLMAMIVLVGCAMPATAIEQDEPHDTVYFYNTWERMIDMRPMAILIDADIEVLSPFHVYIYSDDEALNRKVSETGFIAVSLGDSIWLANGNYIREFFKGDVNNFDGLVPLFFTEKAAYITYMGELSLKEIFFGESPGDEYAIDYYYIDFDKRTVKRVTHKYLSELLADYHDLQVRYEGMKDYKKRYVIEDYFLKYIDRVTSDVLRPTISELTTTTTVQ